MTRLEQQLSQLRDIPGLHRYFHFPRPNNYVFQLIPRDCVIEEYERAIAQSTRALNRADQALLDYCRVVATSHDVKRALAHIKSWEQCLAKRVNLQGIYWAAQAIAELETTVESCNPWRTHIEREYPELRGIFTGISDSLANVLRINVYASREEAVSILTCLMDQLSDESLYAAIDRVEVAKHLHETTADLAPFPQLIIYLHKQEPVLLTQTFGAIRELLRGTGGENRTRNTYAYPWLANATVTHGYYLYKTYLELLGFIDDLYDRRSNYAFSKGSRMGSLLDALT